MSDKAKWAPGQMASGKINVLTPEQAAKEIAERDAEEQAFSDLLSDEEEGDDDDMGYLDEIGLGEDARPASDQKTSKSSAGYVGAGGRRPNGQQCGLCWMFEPPDECVTVAGAIEPAGWCKFFEREHDMSPSLDLTEVLERARKADCMKYLSGISRVLLIEDKDQWNSEYDPDSNRMVVQGKLTAKPTDEQVRTVLHEGGHHAQFKKAVRCFDEFKKAGLGSTANFLAIANKAHTADYQRTGWVDDIDGEVFAESYARFCLDMEMPQPLRDFWSARGPDRKAWKAAQEWD